MNVPHGLFALLLMAGLSFAQYMDDYSVRGYGAPKLAAETSAGLEGSFRLPTQVGLNVTAAEDFVFNMDGETHYWLLGLVWHPMSVSRGWNPGVALQYGHSFAGAFSGWRVNLKPMVQWVSNDDNIWKLDALLGVGNGETRIRIGTEWQWCWNHFFIGPNVGYSVSDGKPWLGGSLGFRMK